MVPRGPEGVKQPTCRLSIRLGDLAEETRVVHGRDTWFYADACANLAERPFVERPEPEPVAADDRPLDRAAVVDRPDQAETRLCFEPLEPLGPEFGGIRGEESEA